MNYVSLKVLLMKIFANLISLVKRKQHLLVNIFIHLSAIFLFVSPEIITNIDDNRPIPNGVIIKTLLYLSIFYINYFFINRFLDRKNGKWHFFGMNTLLLIAASVIILLTSHAYTNKAFHPIEKPPHPHHEHIPPHQQVSSDNKPFDTPPPPPRHEPLDDTPKSLFIHAAGRLSRDLFIAILTIALAFAVRVATRWLELQQKQASLIASQRETELENLKSQINPHFLFNTLNSIYALIDIKPAQAQKAVHELSGMMRYAIYETAEMVTLKQELDFLNNYISLMKMRMNPSRPIDTSLSCVNHDNYKIAPLLFIPIIENAFKYGNIGDVSNPIKINISANDGVVKCYSFNHFDAKKRVVHKDSGVGFNNLQRRLKLIYENDASINIIEQNNTYQVELTINLNNSNS